MLQFIFGLPASGKSYTILQKIKLDVSQGKNVILFVPEQFSFETEKSVLKLLGDGESTKVKVLSFSRLCDEISQLSGGICGKLLSDSDKIILMNKTLTKVKDDLCVFGKYAHSFNFAKTVLDTLGELKVNGISADDIKNAAKSATKKSLKNKLCDIALIYENFDAFLGEKYIDPVDRLTKAYRDLEKINYFVGKTVYFDSFKAFSGQQFKIIDRIFRQADDVCFAFNNDTLSVQEFDIFTVVRKNIAKINQLAQKNRLVINEPIILNEAKYQNQKLSVLERLMAGKDVKADLSDTVTICAADGIFDEADFAARTIRRLCREKGYRFKDFVIVARDTEKYSQAVEYACNKNDVSCYFDRRVSLNTLPFSYAVNSIISALNFSTENILRFHKCGFSKLCVTDISTLENYAFLWNIEGEMWFSEWDMSPRGFGNSEILDEDIKKLQEINRLRVMAIKPISNFKNNFYGNAAQMCKAIVELLKECDAENTLKSLCSRFEEIGSNVSPDILKQGYDAFMRILDSLVICFGEKSLNTEEFKEALNFALSFETVGAIPQYIDEVTFGAADRIETARPKIAFILGANQGVFPKITSNCGIWTANERKTLIDMQIDISDNSILAAIDENYLVYTNVCCANNGLYISYSKNSTGGEELLPSPFVTSICDKLNPTLTYEPYENLSFNNLPETKSAAFSELCRRFSDTTAVKTISEVLDGDTLFQNLNDAVNKNINSISEENAKKLFGKDIYLSATKIDTLNHCRFSYFCKYGLRAEKLRAADFNVLQRGNIVHYVLEKIISEHKDNICDMDDEELYNLTDFYIEEYLAEVKGFKKIRDERFDFLLLRISRSLKEVVVHIANDFKQSEFKPVACEFKIGFEDGIPLVFPYDNGKINIRGSIDRVDKFYDYVRIVDYKTGSKTFKLPDIIYGLNMQMLLYLYAITRGQGIDDKNAAAILYMPAKRPVKDEDTLTMNGLIKGDPDISNAMEPEGKGDFVPPLKITQKGQISKKSPYIEENGFSEIFDYLEKIMRKTGNLISSGDISVSPVDGRESPACKYCDFKSVCFVDDSQILKVPSLDKDEVFKVIREADSNGI